MQYFEFDAFLAKEFSFSSFEGLDKALNGFQVLADPLRQLQRVAFAVDASQATFQAAVDGGAQMLLVHHGLFWGMPSAITSSLYQRVRFLVENNLDLYALHLPLDAHLHWGHNAVWARRLGLCELKAFSFYKGKPLGLWGELQKKWDTRTFLETFFGPLESLPASWLFGSKEIRRVALCCGAGGFAWQEAQALGVDLFITGEAWHQYYHQVMESSMNFVALGHYRSEEAGIEELALQLPSLFKGLETFFIQYETGY